MKKATASVSIDAGSLKDYAQARSPAPVRSFTCTRIVQDGRGLEPDQKEDHRVDSEETPGPAADTQPSRQLDR